MPRPQRIRQLVIAGGMSTTFILLGAALIAYLLEEPVVLVMAVAAVAAEWVLLWRLADNPVDAQRHLFRMGFFLALGIGFFATLFGVIAGLD
jgi:uncharacterized membrane protein YfcA